MINSPRAAFDGILPSHTGPVTNSLFKTSFCAPDISFKSISVIKHVLNETRLTLFIRVERDVFYAYTARSPLDLNDDLVATDHPRKRTYPRFLKCFAWKHRVVPTESAHRGALRK